MNVDIEPKPTREIIPTNVLQQTAFWARLKNKQGWGTHAFDLSLGKSEAFSGTRLRKHEREGDILITLRAIGGGRYMAYVPFGPEQLPDEERRGIWLEEISEQLRNFLPEDCLFIRYDLCWESPWAREEEYFSEDGMWLGPPDAYVQEMRMNFDTRNFNLRKAPSDMLPAHTVMLDLDKEEDALLSEMKSKTRYNIRLSQRKGVEVRRAGMDELDKWFRLYDETYTRNRLAANDLSFFEQVFQTRADDTKSPGEVDLLLAEKDGEAYAGMFLARSGERATYLYGASSGQDRNLQASHALQWGAIQHSKTAGCKEYDMFGISPTPDPEHPMYGLYRFKTGFGGSKVHRQGCWDYSLDEEGYEQYRLAEMNATGYHL
ncbi:lipid II:glycine glycyltransferase FemX [Marinilabilia salmonicolor]|uniref:lipid II:glycine glycyltransferase FemX n=2 Tax=Marinilabilia salmonicolor TaxID=989 RepID=UPI00029B5617|nr:peptidoglycan bridge formation glycyltransferase FemA/FemB family protein [Marinilabilia salmonicolor]